MSKENYRRLAENISKSGLLRFYFPENQELHLINGMYAAGYGPCLITPSGLPCLRNGIRCREVIKTYMPSTGVFESIRLSDLPVDGPVLVLYSRIGIIRRTEKIDGSNIDKFYLV